MVGSRYGLISVREKRVTVVVNRPESPKPSASANAKASSAANSRSVHNPGDLRMQAMRAAHCRTVQAAALAATASIRRSMSGSCNRP